METQTEPEIAVNPAATEAAGSQTKSPGTPAPAPQPSNVHKVYVLYVGTQLEVSGYPPAELEVGDVIEFIPVPQGKLTLTFEDGFNFAKKGTSSYAITSEPGETAIQKIERLMTRAELAELQKREYTRPTPDGVYVQKNAFPFMCKLEVPGVEGVFSQVYQSGFPTRPH